jgi:hypothetical protein
MPCVCDNCIGPPIGRMLRGLLLPTLVWTLASASWVESTQAQSEEAIEASREYAIKAAYLYQFGRYVQWPSSAFPDDSAALVIGVLGADPFGVALEEIARTKRVEGRPIVIRRFATMAEHTPCHILFVTASVSPEQKAAAIKKADNSAVLLVGEEPGFAEQGGMVNFFLDENRVRFEISAAAANHKQLKVSSKLLSLAKIVGVGRY